MPKDRTKMDIELIIKHFSVKIIPTVRADSIKAFVEWVFGSNMGEIKIRGGTIRLKSFGDSKEVLSYEPPAYGKKYQKAIFIDNKEFYKKLCDYTINKYCDITGEILAGVEMNEDIDPDEIQI